MKHHAPSFWSIAAAVAATACGNVTVEPPSSGGSGGATTGETQGGAGTTTSWTFSETFATTSSGDTGCEGGPDSDQDGDGFSPNQGDCNDCEAAMNPNAVEIPNNVLDDNCDGTIDEPSATCDGVIAIDTLAPEDAARAMELCKVSSGPKSWGLIKAAWTMPDGSAPPAEVLEKYHVGHGVLSDFGPNVPPRAGSQLLALSNGLARHPGDPGYVSNTLSKGYPSAPAEGFPVNNPDCSPSGDPYDAVALEVQISVPSNAYGFFFDYDFYTSEFPGTICTKWDDTFFTLHYPLLPGLATPNIAFDDMGNPVTCNTTNFHVCSCPDGPPCQVGPKLYSCDLGTDQLEGTGFEGSVNGYERAATGWLRTAAPSEPGSTITLRWGIYDASDGNVTSTTLLDNWQWITDKGMTVQGGPPSD